MNKEGNTTEHHSFTTHTVDMHEDMAAYDKLPPAIRKAVANSAAPWCASILLKALKRDPARFLLKAIAEGDAELLSKPMSAD